MKEYFQNKKQKYDRVPVVQWKQKWIDHQHIEKQYYEIEHEAGVHELVYGNVSANSQFMHATGNTYSSFATQLLFVYLGAMVQAKKQNIPGLLFFKNRYYNWINGSKYIAGGYFFSLLMTTFAFGKPYLLEDWIRSIWRSVLEQPFAERDTLMM